jgi:hypothetical protein
MRNYLIAKPSNLGNFMIADSRAIRAGTVMIRRRRIVPRATW